MPRKFELRFEFAAKRPFSQHGSVMKITPLFGLILCLALLDGPLARGEETNKIASAGVMTLPSGKQIKVLKIVPMHFGNGSDALMLNCETDISIGDQTALRKQADEIWSKFRNNVEGAHMTNGVISVTHPEGSGLITRSKGYGFVFEKQADGQWRCLQDEKK